MKREKNRKTLARVLRDLPPFYPGEIHWSSLEKSLQKPDKENVFQNLTQFEPPDHIWDRIDQKLSEKKKAYINHTVIKLVKWTPVAAAVIALLMLIMNSGIFNRNKYTYKEEWLITTLNDWNRPTNDTLVYRQITLACNQKPEICRSDEFTRMKTTLEFLDNSKQEIISQLNRYEPDNELKVMLERIEKERSVILDQMKTFIN